LLLVSTTKYVIVQAKFTTLYFFYSFFKFVDQIKSTFIASYMCGPTVC